MNSASEDLYMQQLQEFIHDDDKVITVPTAALLLKINIQNARDLLNKYVKDNKKDLAITYILSGILKDNEEKAVCIVKEADLDKKKNFFKNVSGETIYSVQKCKDIDFNIISLANKDELEKPREQALLGFVVSKNCVKRVIKSKNLPTPPAPTIRGKSAVFMKNTKPEEKKVEKKVEKKSPEKSKEANKKEEKPVVTNKKTETKSKQNGIAHMFSKVPPKTTKSTEDNKVKKEQDENKETVKNGKSNHMEVDDEDTDEEIVVDKKEKKEKEKTKKTPKKTGKSNDMEVDDEDTEEEIIVVTKEKKEKEKTKKTPKKLDNKRSRKNSSEGPNKRRKRIIQRIDSDSDDMFEKEEEDNEEEVSIIEASDEEPEPVKTKKPLAAKNKKRKAIEKTYKDDEGFIVTKTEYIWESGSDNEEEEIKKPVEKQKPKMEKKNSSNSETEISPTKKIKKGAKNEVKNQPSIMNFFKKK